MTLFRRAQFVSSPYEIMIFAAVYDSNLVFCCAGQMRILCQFCLTPSLWMINRVSSNLSLSRKMSTQAGQESRMLGKGWPG